MRFTPSLNLQTDRTRGLRFNLLHRSHLDLGRVQGNAQTVFG